MKRHIIAGVTALVIGSGSVSAQSFSDGIAAYVGGDYETALAIWEPLAEQGDLLAQFNLGIMYSQSLGVARDDAAAAQWFERAALQGDPVAAYNLALFYAEGRGVEQDYSISAQWHQVAADQGHAGALSRLANHYAMGRGVEQNLMRALELSEIARQTECLLGDTELNHQARMSLELGHTVGG